MPFGFAVSASALAFIASCRDKARLEELQGVAMPLSIAGVDYMVQLHEGAGWGGRWLPLKAIKSLEALMFGIYN